MTRLKWLIFAVFLGISADNIIPERIEGRLNDTLTDEFDCFDRNAGLHAVAQCYPHLVYCVHDLKHIMTCPNDLVFNAVTSVCDDLDNCLKQATDPSTAAVLAPKSVRHYMNVTEADFDCKYRRDGFFHLEKCGNKYVYCFEQKKQKLPYQLCPGEAYIHGFPGQCTSVEHCMKCMNLLEATNHIDAFEKAKAAQCYGAVKFHYERICEDKPSGYYTSSCNSYFYFCYERDGMQAQRYTCPIGLIFDAKKIRCVRRETIPECATIGLPRLPHPFPVIPEDDNFCRDKETRFYGNNCSNFWYSCSMGITYKFTCPEQMFYDKEKNHCALKEDITACGIPVSAPLTYQIQHIRFPYNKRPIISQHNGIIENSATDAPKSYDIRCKDKTTGFYGIGCDNTFYFCNNGYQTKYSCPEYLRFDVENIGCASNGKVEKCSFSSDQNYGIRSIVPSTFLDGCCRERENGFYGEDCSSFFYSCSDGHTYKFYCPQGTYYDKEKKACDVKEDIAACNGTTSSAAHNESNDNTVTSVEAVSENFCYGKRNGFHGNHCGTIFYFCKFGTTYNLRCPEGMIFDVDEHSCVSYSETCFAGSENNNNAYRDTKGHFALLCEQQKDGYFAHGCQRHVVRCVNGRETRVECYRGFYYDSERYRCDHKNNIKSCKSKATPVISTSSTRSAATRDASPANMQNISCSGVDDGHYPVSMGCSQFFHICVANVSYPMKCPDGLVFNHEEKRCDSVDILRHTVEHCDEVPPETPEMLKEQGRSCANRWPIVAHSWDNLDDVFCFKKKDGPYKLWECISWYILCENGTTKHAECPYSYLIYNITTKQCDSPWNSDECAMVKLRYISNLTHLDPWSGCSNKRSGQYSIGDCSQSFAVCSDEIQYDLKCPANLVYNVEKKHCDKRENVKMCEGVPMVTTVASTTAEPKRITCNSLEKPPTYQTVITKWHKVKELFCYQMEDGDYTLWDCSSYYIRCVNGTFNMLQCPDNLVFNPKNNKCDDEDNMVMCTPHLGAETEKS